MSHRHVTSHLARLPSVAGSPENPAGSISAVLKRALGNAGLHEFYAAADADSAATAGFALAMASLVRKRKSIILWARHDLLQGETGGVYPPGLIELGISPDAVTLVRARDVRGVLQAGLDAARCSSLAVILVEFWGNSPAYDLTASRRLSLAAKTAGTALFLLRHGAAEIPSAAKTRLRVTSLSSRLTAAQAPGRPAFDITLLRHRGGMAGKRWLVEWNRDTARFEDRSGTTPGAAPLSGTVASLSRNRAAAPGGGR